MFSLRHSIPPSSLHTSSPEVTGSGKSVNIITCCRLESRGVACSTAGWALQAGHCSTVLISVCCSVLQSCSLSAAPTQQHGWAAGPRRRTRQSPPVTQRRAGEATRRQEALIKCKMYCTKTDDINIQLWLFFIELNVRGVMRQPRPPSLPPPAWPGPPPPGPPVP